MKQFIEDVRDGSFMEKNYTKLIPLYEMTKIALNAYTFILHREIKDAGKDVVLNAVHPGLISTDLNFHMGTNTINEGARSALKAATLPKGTDVDGKFLWEDGEVRDWIDGDNEYWRLDEFKDKFMELYKQDPKP